MSAKKYLLPCACGRHVLVEPRQAGEQILCECGASLVAPTLLDMRTLEPAPESKEPTSARTVWGLPQQVRLAGLVVLVIALGCEGVLYWFRPVSPTVDAFYIQEMASRFTPAQTWDVWRQTVDQGFDRRTDQGYEEELARSHFLLTVVGVIFLIGAGLTIAGTWFRTERC
ncbi:MAG: hypothetical protein ABFC77_02250 [Thermoguttaceae bacterium]